MKKIIWVLEKKRENMIDIQRKINAYGGMGTLCMFSIDALKKHMDGRSMQGSNMNRPSLLLIDYEFIKEDFAILTSLKSYPSLAGVPVFFLIEQDTPMQEEFYLRFKIFFFKTLTIGS